MLDHENTGGPPFEASRLSLHRALGPTPGRTQHLITRLKDAQVLYFCPGGGLLDQRWRQPGRKVRPNVTVYTMPPALPVDERHDRLFRLSRQRQIRFLADKLARHRFRRPLLWTTSLSISTPWMRWSTTVWSTTATRCGRAARPVGGQSGWCGGRGLCRFPRAGRPPLPVQRQHRAASQQGELPSLRRRQAPPGVGGAGPPARALLGWRHHPCRPGFDPHPLCRPGPARLDLPATGAPGRKPSAAPSLPPVQCDAGRPLPAGGGPPTIWAAARFCWTCCGTASPITTWSRPGSMSISPPASPSYPCCGRNRWSSSPMWSTAPTPGGVPPSVPAGAGGGPGLGGSAPPGLRCGRRLVTAGRRGQAHPGHGGPAVSPPPPS